MWSRRWPRRGVAAGQGWAGALWDASRKRWSSDDAPAGVGMPKDEASAHEQARAAIAQGTPKDEVNKRLKAAGLKPL